MNVVAGNVAAPPPIMYTTVGAVRVYPLANALLNVFAMNGLVAADNTRVTGAVADLYVATIEPVKANRLLDIKTFPTTPVITYGCAVTARR